MKKLFSLFLLLSAYVAYAQTSVSDTVEYRSPYVDQRPVVCTKTYRLDDDRRIHGSCVVKGSDVIRKAGVVNEQHFSENRTYSHGHLQGPFSQTYSHSGRGSKVNPYKVLRHWTAKGQFNQGHPDGRWTFSLRSDMNTGVESSTTQYTYTLQFELGRLTSMTDNQGHRLQFHDDGTVSGTAVSSEYRTVNLSHSVVTNFYQPLDGKQSPIPQQIDSILAPGLTSFQRADQGYAIDYQELRILQISRSADIVNRYIRLGMLDTSLTASPLTQVGVLRAVKPVASDVAFDYYIQTPGSADRLLERGYYERRHRKYFLDSEAENRIRSHHTQYQCDLLSHKLDILVNLMDRQSWNGILADCRSGQSPLLDMVAASWTNHRFEDQCEETATMLDQGFRSLYPLRGFRILTATYTPFQGLEAQVEFHVIKSDSIQYASVVVPVKTSPSGHILLGRLNPDDYSTQPNVWDTITLREQQLNSRHRELIQHKNPCAECAQYYREQYETLFNDKSILPEVRLKDLQTLERLQEDYSQELRIEE